MLFNWEVAIRAVLISFATVLAYLLAMRLLMGVLKTINHGISGVVKKERVKTLSFVISNLLAFGLAILGALVILANSGVEIGPLLAGLGILGLGFGLAAQTLIRDYIFGFFILFENHYNVGDELEIQGKRGWVKELTLRYTILEGKEGQTYFFPNSQIIQITKFPQERES